MCSCTVPGPVSGLSATSRVVSSQSHGLLPQNLMVSSQCIRSPTTALEYWTTPTHQPHSSHWGSSPWDCELDHSWSGWQTRHWTRNCTGTHSNNGTIMICSLLTILQCLHSESCTVWSSPSSIDCCHLHRVVGEWESVQSTHAVCSPLL